jgi:hypothetical protein
MDNNVKERRSTYNPSSVRTRMDNNVKERRSIKFRKSFVLESRQLISEVSGKFNPLTMGRTP